MLLFLTHVVVKAQEQMLRSLRKGPLAAKGLRETTYLEQLHCGGGRCRCGEEIRQPLILKASYYIVESMQLYLSEDPTSYEVDSSYIKLVRWH